MSESISPAHLREAFLGWLGRVDGDPSAPETPLSRPFLGQMEARVLVWAQGRKRFDEALGDTSPEEWRRACEASLETGSYSARETRARPHEATLSPSGGTRSSPSAGSGCVVATTLGLVVGSEIPAVAGELASY
jgi:hypothetical protein